VSVKNYSAARGYLAIAVIFGWALIALGVIALFAMLSEARVPAMTAIATAAGFVFLGFLSLVAAQVLDAHLDTATNTARLVEQNATLLKAIERAFPKIQGTRPSGRGADQNGRIEPSVSRGKPSVPTSHYNGVAIHKIDGAFETLGQRFETLSDAELAIFRKFPKAP
jgi:hypothetical protein